MSKSVGGAPRSLLSALLESNEGQSLLSVVAAVGAVDPLDTVIPPGTVLDGVASAIRGLTDLEPGAGVAVLVSIISSSLAAAGATVRWTSDSSLSELSLWIVLLAPSGAGKTLITRVVKDALDVQVGALQEPGSAAAFLDALAARAGRARWERDEYGQLLKAMRRPGPMAELKDQMLRAYDHNQIELTTRKNGTVIVNRPVLSVFGSTVLKTWSNCIDAEMMSDGLVARHLFFVCTGRPLAVPIYALDTIKKSVRASVSFTLRNRIKQKVEYVISPAAENYFREKWCALVKGLAGQMDAAYVRRITWSAGTYAVIYHLVLEQPGSEIGTEAMAWAWRMVQYHLTQLKLVLDMSDPGFTSKFLKMVDWIRSEAIKNPTQKDLRRRLIQRFSRDLGSITESAQLIDFALKTASV